MNTPFLGVRLKRGPGQSENIAVTRGVDNDLGEDRMAAFFALDEHTANLVALLDGSDPPRVQTQIHPPVLDHLQRRKLEHLRVDHGGPGNHSVERCISVLPVRDQLGIRRSPQLVRRAQQPFLRHAVEEIVGKTCDHLPPGPIRHAIDPQNESTGRHATEMAVALHQNGVCAHSGCRGGGSRACRTPTNDQDIAFRGNRDLSSGLQNGSAHTPSLLVSATRFRIQQDPLAPSRLGYSHILR